MFKLYILLLLSYFTLACNQHGNRVCNCICNCDRRKRHSYSNSACCENYCHCGGRKRDLWRYESENDEYEYFEESENDEYGYFEESFGHDLDCPEDQKQFICKSVDGEIPFYFYR